MDDVSYRAMVEADLARLAEIDRSESIRVGYRARGETLTQIAVVWDSPPFEKHGDGPHSVAHQIEFCRRHLAAGATMVGAFHASKLVGVGVITPEVRPGMAQLAYLHVSNGYRRQGIASSIAQRLLAVARDLDARRLYVSATPTQSAVGFYRSLGFRPVAEPLPELFELEPEDVHMILDLTKEGSA